MWRQHAETVEAFLSICTQWRFAPVYTRDGVHLKYIGLDYASVRAGLDAAGLRVTPALFARLQVMEHAARRALNGEG